MAIKFYSEEGNWDLLGLNSPMFFIRDPILFPSLIHAIKRSTRTNLKVGCSLNIFFLLFFLLTMAVLSNFILEDLGLGRYNITATRFWRYCLVVRRPSFSLGP